MRRLFTAVVLVAAASLLASTAAAAEPAGAPAVTMDPVPDFSRDCYSVGSVVAKRDWAVSSWAADLVLVAPDGRTVDHYWTSRTTAATDGTVFHVCPRSGSGTYRAVWTLRGWDGDVNLVDTVTITRTFVAPRVVPVVSFHVTDRRPRLGGRFRLNASVAWPDDGRPTVDSMQGARLVFQMKHRRGHWRRLAVRPTGVLGIAHLRMRADRRGEVAWMRVCSRTTTWTVRACSRSIKVRTRR